jgi:two-component system, chemotaxis family, CheB/CheR fusion protein
MGADANGGTASVSAVGAQDQEVESSDRPSLSKFLIVGIGASAGGLAAFEAFFSAMPADRDTGMAFVVVQHLAPGHDSLLPALIRRYTRMQVFEVTDGMRVEPNSVYVSPPNHDLAFSNGALQLSDPAAPRGRRLPIDSFFRSLAKDQREQAICIVLSGTGSDGTLGLRAVKGENGIAFAQNPESTDSDAMPRSAISTGLVDYILPPAEMPAQLIAFGAFAQDRRSSRPSDSEAEGDLKQVFALLLAQTGHDFSHYKPSTIRRRIERRMGVQRIGQLGKYILYLHQTPGEVQELFRDLLIGVTNFFRDPDCFKALETQVLPRLLADRAPDNPIRVWVPGCSTGEEAYSIAFLLRERLDALKLNPRVQVFATDIDSRAIETARAGVYPSTVAVDMTPERFTKFFTPAHDDNCRIQKRIRDWMVFSEQDVTQDPPFSRLDLISCRNLMIYMGPELQKELIPRFHYALRPGGALFLGTSETVGEFATLFRAVDRKAKLYQRNDDVRVALRAFRGVPREHDYEGSLERVAKPAPPKLDSRALMEQTLLEHAPIAALVNATGELIYLHGHSGQYLQPAPGAVGVNILEMAREGLRDELTMSLHLASSTREPVLRSGLLVRTNGHCIGVNLSVRPVTSAAEGTSALFVVMFEPASEAEMSLLTGAAPGSAQSHLVPENANQDRLLALLRELRVKDEYLLATREEMQTSNEELRSSNEELQSTNEELQSTNEELETSKEELQSVNEELAIVNAELQGKVADLSGINNDMNNLFAGTGIGTVFVDQQLRVRRFTPAITQFINLIQTDVGRPLGHIVTNLIGYDSLIADMQAVLETLKARDVEVQTRGFGWFRLRIRPYRTTENVVEGVVVTFTEMLSPSSVHAIGALERGIAD